MRISLNKGKIEGHVSENSLGFAKLIENSFNEWSRSEELSGDTIPWSLIFKIEEAGEEEMFYVDTNGEYLVYLDLDGYMMGEMIELDEERELKLVAKHSYMYELICFSEIMKLGVLGSERVKELEQEIFPEWANGVVADDLEDNETVARFMQAFAPVLDKLEIVKRVDIDIDDFEVEAVGQEEEFKEYIKNYVKEELFFLVHNPLYAELYPDEGEKLMEATKEFASGE